MASQDQTFGANWPNMALNRGVREADSNFQWSTDAMMGRPGGGEAVSGPKLAGNRAITSENFQIMVGILL